MAVIADFAAYPAWAKGVKTRRGRSRRAPTGGPSRSTSSSTSRPIKDEYTLAYDWDGDDEVTWTLVEGKMLQGARRRLRRCATSATGRPR